LILIISKKLLELQQTISSPLTKDKNNFNLLGWALDNYMEGEVHKSFANVLQ